MTQTNDDILGELAASEVLPRQALADALVHVEELAPRFLQILERGADGKIVTPEEQSLFFFGVHVLGAARHTAAFPLLMRFLRDSNDESIDSLLGDSVTMTLPRVVAGLYDGNSAALFDLLARPEADPFVRWGVFGALTFLTWEGRIDRAETMRFLERFDDERLAAPLDLAWVGWHDTVGLLGLREFSDRAEAIWTDGRMPPDLMDRELLEEQFTAAETAAPGDASRFTAEGLGYLDDLVGDLAWVDEDPDEDDDEDEEAGVRSEPVRNPLRNVGRNDPCPCGSGKKAKNCCLAESSA